MVKFSIIYPFYMYIIQLNQFVQNLEVKQCKYNYSMSQEHINLQFKNYQEVEEHADKNDKTLLILQDYVLDVTSFAQHHPGGAMLLKNSTLQNIDQQMKFHHPLTLIMANSMVIGTFKKDIERIINPNVPLLPQIWNLDHQGYMKVINSPHWLFVPSPRMFQTDFFESFSHNKWYAVPVLPTIAILYFFLKMVPQKSYQETNRMGAFLLFLLGYFSFSLAEYLIHRFIFHSQSYLPDSKVARYVHYIAHGIHHMLPNDPDRLVYPPILQLITAILGYFTVCQVIAFQDPLHTACFWTGFLLGYCTYDICHYSLHHIDTSKNHGSYFHRLQQHHNQHHFGGQQAGFGVSSKLWDIILRTGYKLKKNKGQ